MSWAKSLKERWFSRLMEACLYPTMNPSDNTAIPWESSRRNLGLMRTIRLKYCLLRGFSNVSVVKSLLAIQETRVLSLGQEDPLEEEMATHSSILAWKIPWTKEPGRLQSMASQRVRHNWAHTDTYIHLHFLPKNGVTLYIMLYSLIF